MTNTPATGRSSLISAKALAYAIGQIQSLPNHRQEHGDMSDMCRALRACHGGKMLAHLVASVECHTGNPVNIFPDGDEELDAGEKLHKAAYEQARGEEYVQRIALHQKYADHHTYEWTDPAALAARAGISLDLEANKAAVSAAMDEALSYYKDNAADVMPPQAPGFRVTISEGLGDIEIEADPQFGSQAADLARHYESEGADVALIIGGHRVPNGDAEASSPPGGGGAIASHEQLTKVAKETVAHLIEQERALRKMPASSTRH